ncbi:ABC transporter ATP-binding protein [Flavobacterium agricola]|uniref:ABC transporter ATP-binding protein n=1 Tax=Flavobacterium agricola TaxID=2870839 RepID=UPI0037445FC6
MGIISAERVFEVLDTTEHVQPTGTKSLDRLKGDIELKQVRFSYVHGEEVLKGIDLKVKAGETIAIVGTTGAGKSTIINLLNRFYDIDSGEILLDGHDLYDFKVEDLRKNIAVVLQDVFLFADSIYNNIALYNPNITKQDVIEAAKKIGAHEFIMQLPGGYDFNVKERGGMLSSGQRQLIAFIRAYVAKPNILILDEATSSIDSYTEELIQTAIERLTKNSTSIVIAHRLATIQHADRIIVMDKGKIIEEGNHYDLITIPNGYYKKLYESQFKNNL